MKTTLPIAIAFLSGFVIIVSFLFNPERTIIGQIEAQLLVWVTIIGGFTLLLGVVSITRVNYSKVASRSEGWGYNLAALLSVFVMAIPAVLPSSLSPLYGDAEGSIYDWLFTNLSTPMAQAMFGMLAYYIASAAYRAFRARNLQSTILLLTATLVMLWRVPMGESFLNLFGESISDSVNTYIMGGVNLAVQRGIIIGAALGAASMSLRVMLGIERTYMGKG